MSERRESQASIPIGLAEKTLVGKGLVQKLPFLAPLLLTACQTVAAATGTSTLVPPEVKTGVPATEVPTNPGVTPTGAPTEVSTKVPEIVPPTAIDYSNDEIFTNAQFGSILELSGDKLIPKNNIPLEPANEAQWILNAQNNAHLVTARTGTAPSATQLFTNGQPDGASRNAAMSFSGQTTIMWPSFTDGQSTFLSASPSEYWFPVQADQSKVTYTKVNLPPGYTREDVRMGWIGDKQSVEVAAKGGKGMMVFNPTTKEWRELKNLPSTETLTSVITSFVHAFGDKVIVNGIQFDSKTLLTEVQANPDNFIKKMIVRGVEEKFLMITTTTESGRVVNVPLAILNENGEWTIPGYEDVAPQGFNVGSEINTWTGPNLTNQKYTEAFMDNFNIGTPGGIIDFNLYSKIENKKQTPDQIIQSYNWNDFDTVTKFMTESKKPYLLMHVFPGWLFTHVTAPEWMRQMSDQELSNWMVKHMESIAAHMKQNGLPEPKAISVVNELLWHGKDRNAVDQVWFEGDYLYSRLHDEYIKTAFTTADRLWPNADLLLNDDNATEGVQTNTPLNAEAQVELNYIKKMRAAGVPIDGFGSQSHLLARNFIEGSGTPEQNFEKNLAIYKQQLASLIKQYGDIGVKFYITELDVNIGGLPSNFTPKQKEDLKAQIYDAVFETCLDSENCDTINTWGFTNASTWVLDSQEYPNSPGESPLPLDSSFNPTQSAFEIKSILLDHNK
ncbi:MAG: endo-1,4-beta-xylanase [Candidatus Roizmanbacteria bacterium]|nr:endo-1,4-beta-xylanase [Candidatus Roizmanbacteria bacterium]